MGYAGASKIEGVTGRDTFKARPVKPLNSVAGNVTRTVMKRVIEVPGG